MIIFFHSNVARLGKNWRRPAATDRATHGAPRSCFFTTRYFNNFIFLDMSRPILLASRFKHLAGLIWEETTILSLHGPRTLFWGSSLRPSCAIYVHPVRLSLTNSNLALGGFKRHSMCPLSFKWLMMKNFSGKTWLWKRLIECVRCGHWCCECISRLRKREGHHCLRVWHHQDIHLFGLWLHRVYSNLCIFYLFCEFPRSMYPNICRIQKQVTANQVL